MNVYIMEKGNKKVNLKEKYRAQVLDGCNANYVAYFF